MLKMGVERGYGHEVDRGVKAMGHGGNTRMDEEEGMREGNEGWETEEGSIGGGLGAAMNLSANMYASVTPISVAGTRPAVRAADGARASSGLAYLQVLFVRT
jgi:hypothetical protein